MKSEKIERFVHSTSGAGTHGNGVPTREILSFYCYFYYQMLPCYNVNSVHLRPCHDWTSEFAKYLEHLN